MKFIRVLSLYVVLALFTVFVAASDAVIDSNIPLHPVGGNFIHSPVETKELYEHTEEEYDDTSDCGDTLINFNVLTYIDNHNCSLSDFPFCPRLWKAVKVDVVGYLGLRTTTPAVPKRVPYFPINMNDFQRSKALALVSAAALSYVIIKFVDMVMDSIF